MDIKDFIQKNKEGIIYFKDPKCGPCKISDFSLKSLKEIRGIPLMVVNVNEDTDKEIVERFEVKAVPYVVFFKNGETLKMITGAKSLRQYKELLGE